MAGEAVRVLRPANAAVPASWSWGRLDSVCEGIYDCPHSTPLLAEHGPYIARSQDIRSGVFRVDSAARVSEETYRERTSRAEPRYGDLLYSREGTYFGIAAEVPDDVRVCLGQRMVLIRPDPRVIDSRFLLYWLNAPVVAAHIHGFRDGSVAERLNMPTIRALPVAIPPLEEQHAIAHILGALDDKIELDRLMNETLEAMALAVFKSWFVEFEPVRRKSGGRDAGLPSPLADCFPDRLEKTPLGEIPSGWVVQPFSTTIDIIGGGTPKTSVAEYWDGDIPWFSVADAPSRSDVWVLDTERRITQAGLDNSATKVLSPGTTIISARGTVGRVALVGVPMAMNQSCYGLVAQPETGRFFTYYAARELVSILQRRAHGSVFDTITRDTLASVSIAVPPPRVVRAFESHVGPMLERIRTSLLESRTLSAVRDALLPRLVSGDLGVADAERLLKAVPG